tara:strand:- start:279 stop:503 length:225 start_codon:yes stop_codon:yes gene_type:complete
LEKLTLKINIMKKMKGYSYKSGGVSMKADLDNDGKLSSYEKKRGTAIQNALETGTMKYGGSCGKRIKGSSLRRK